MPSALVRFVSWASTPNASNASCITLRIHSASKSVSVAVSVSGSGVWLESVPRQPPFLQSTRKKLLRQILGVVVRQYPFALEQHDDWCSICAHYKIEGPMYPKYAKMRAAKRVFSITLNNSAIQEEFSSFVEPELKQMGVEFKREVFDWGFSDYRTLAAKAKEFQPDLIFINGFSVHILPAIQALRSQEMVKDGNVLCVMDFLDLLYNETPKSELAGVVSIAPPFDWTGHGRP